MIILTDIETMEEQFGLEKWDTFWTCRVLDASGTSSRNIHQQADRKSGKEIYTYIADFQQECQGNSREKRVILSTNNARTTGYPYTKKINLDPYFTLYIKINSKCTIGLNV